MFGRFRFLFLACITTAAGIAPAQATPCLVIGDTSAKVSTSEGVHSPVFLASSCESVQLVSGTAQASWVGRDGKPRIVPITSSGPDASPEPGAPDHPTYLVWYELTSKREAQRPAFRRDLMDEAETSIYIPAEGLLLSDSAAASTRVQINEISFGGETPVANFQVEAGQAVRLSADRLQADKVYRVEVRRAESIEQWQWHILPDGDAAKIRQSIQAIQTSVTDLMQQGLVVAMLYEQQHLSDNRKLLMKQLRK